MLTSIIVFLVTQLLPGDVCRVILGREVGEGALADCRERLGLDDPAALRYLRWLGSFLQGDWGESFSTRSLIRPLVLERLENSLRLALVTMVISVPLALFLGVVAGLNAGRPLDSLIRIGSLAVVGLPGSSPASCLSSCSPSGWNGWLQARFGLSPFPANSSVRPDTTFRVRCPCSSCPR